MKSLGTLVFALSLVLALPGAVASGEAPPPAPSPRPASPGGRDVRYVVLHTPGEKWVAGKPMFEQPGLELHIAHYRRLLEQGKLAIGGPFLDAGGGMMIPEAGLTEQEIVEFAHADPAVKSGLLKVEVRPWLVGMKR